MASHEVVEAIAARLKAGEVIRVADRPILGIAGKPIEHLLASVLELRNVLLHGTGEIIASGTPLRLSPGRARYGPRRAQEGFATDEPAIALLKSLFSNKGINLRYPMVISKDSPLWLLIDGWKPEAERTRGYVHLIGPKSSFERERDTWQWVTSRTDVCFGGCIEVEKADFNYRIMRKPDAEPSAPGNA